MLQHVVYGHADRLFSTRGSGCRLLGLLHFLLLITVNFAPASPLFSSEEKLAGHWEGSMIRQGASTSFQPGRKPKVRLRA